MTNVKVDSLDPTSRFSDRAVDYDRYRPSYPGTLLDFLDQRTGGLRGIQVADVGAGTGIFSQLLLDRGAKVHAVEPNDEMRAIAVRRLGAEPGFSAVPGSAENTGLPAASVDLITCAQAFHWFDPIKTRLEFDRIIKAGGWIALIWNDQTTTDGFGHDYNQFKTEFGGENLKKVLAVTENLDAVIPQFFAARKSETKIFEYHQDHDLEGLIGRYYSSSYSPQASSPLRAKATAGLEALFAKHAVGGVVRFQYKTELFLGS